MHGFFLRECGMRFRGVFWSMVCSQGGGGFGFVSFCFVVLFEPSVQRFPQHFGSSSSVAARLRGRGIWVTVDSGRDTGLETNNLNYIILLNFY